MLNNLKIATWMDIFNLSCFDNHSPCAISLDQSKVKINFKLTSHCCIVVIIEL